MALPQDFKSPDKLPLECAVFGSDNAIRASKAGAQRIELNTASSYKAGGLTPELHELEACKKAEIKAGIRIMIRPRGAPLKCAELDFVYKEAEKQKMRDSIKQFKDVGHMDPLRGDGFVFGALKLAQGSEVERDATAGYFVDNEFCQELVRLAKPYPCVFHRAFDQIAHSSLTHAIRELHVIASSGFKGVLTSGGLEGSYYEHFEKLDAIREKMNRDTQLQKLQLIVGGGLRARNVHSAIKHLGTHIEEDQLWLHSAAVKSFDGTANCVPPKAESTTGNDASSASNSDRQSRENANKVAQKAAKEAKLALAAKEAYDEEEVQGVEHVSNDVDTNELRELLSRLADPA